MNNLSEFTRNAAKRYLQNIVFVDDEIYANLSGKPATLTSEIPGFSSPFVSASEATEADATPSAADTSPEEESIPYHPKQLVGSFAKQGMVCALYEPSDGFETSNTSEIFKLCERADAVIFDWDLFGYDGSNILPLICNLVDQSQSSVPHSARLCIIYTTKPNLVQVANQIFESLSRKNLTVSGVQELTTLVAGSTRIVVLGKPNVPGRSSEISALEVAEEDLADRVIDEFSKMHAGVLPSYALHGMASIRRGSKKILDKFHKDLDGPFLLHRALLIKDADAFQQLPELLAEEALAVMLADPVLTGEAELLAVDASKSIELTPLNWPVNAGRPARERGELERMYLAGGAPAISEDYSFPKKRVPISDLHSAMGCGSTNADKRLAALFNLRTQYIKATAPSLGFGAIVRWQGDEGAYFYAICLMPICDSVRLKCGVGAATSFPFWTLKPDSSGASSRGLVVETPDGNYIDLFAMGKPRDMLWIDSFSPAESGAVIAAPDGELFIFQGIIKKLEWVAQLKPSHAQRVAHDIGQSFSRVGVVEAEWLRILTEGR